MNRLALACIGALSTLVASSARADLTSAILNGIQSGTRTITADITSLKGVPVPRPSNLAEFVSNEQKAIELGKALFWDMQLGSDGVQACGSCHFNAGADSRSKNQLSPGLLRVEQDTTPDPDNSFASGTGANHQLRVSDFPLHEKQDPLRFDSAVVRDTNDVVSSQGVHFAEFAGGPAADPDGFRVGNVNTRRVEPRNTPTVINAVFNHRQFWDGRASDIFNGVNSFGARDPFAFVYRVGQGSTLEAVRVSIDNASLASQAVAPPLSSLEMSANGRTWVAIGDQFIGRARELAREKGRRIANLRPLAGQLVHPEDSVLGPLSRPQGGLTVPNYATLIRQAFKPEWWNSQRHIRIEADGSRTIVNQRQGDNTFSQMEMNFALFFGIAVQLYEATLVSDDSPVDRFLDGDTSALSQAALVGFHLADDEGRCLNCHGQGEFTFAAVRRVSQQGLTRIRQGDLIDEGFNNIGVRPALEDLGVGGADPFGNPLSFARLTHLGGFDNPFISGTAAELGADLAADGAFKIPTLRNVALTAPYFHNGGHLTLEGVIDFYFRGGDFRSVNAAAAHPVIGFDAERENVSLISGVGILRGPLLDSGPGLDDIDRANLVAFLEALTDERVRLRQAPFDHPQLFVPDGHPGSSATVTDDGNGQATDSLLEIPAVGRNGGPPLSTFLDGLAP